MKFEFIIFCTVFITTHVFAQVDSTDDLRVSGVKLAYTYSGLHNMEIGYGKGRLIPVREMIGPAGYYGGFVNLGYAVENNTSLLTTRVSYELMTVLPGARVSLINFTDFDQAQLVLLPEIGLTFNAIITAMYGYNVYLTTNQFDLRRHSFSVSIIPYWREKRNKRND